MKQLNDWSLLRTFLGTARAGSMQGAARALARSRPTIGREIAQLERIVGCKLFFRTTSGVILTDAGQQILGVAENLENQIRVIPQILSVGPRLCGTVRYRGTDEFASYCLPRLLDGFYQAFPNVTVNLECGDALTPTDLSRREADFAMMYSAPTGLDVCVVKEGMITWSLCVAKQYAEAHSLPSSLDDLFEHPVVIHEALMSADGPWRRIALALCDHPQIVLRSNSMLALVRSVNSAMGLSILPTTLIAHEPDILFLDIEPLTVLVPFWLASHVEAKNLPAVRAVLDHLKYALAACFFDKKPGAPVNEVALARGCGACAGLGLITDEHRPENC